MSDNSNVEAIIASHFNALATVGERATSETVDDRKFIDAVARGMAILEAFGRRAGPLSNADLHDITGYSKPAITRLTHTFVMLGYLRRVENGRFDLTPNVASLARPFHVATAARLPNDALAALATSGPWCIVVAEPSGAELIVVAVFRSGESGSPECAIGTRLDLATTSAGRAWVATLGAEARRRVVSSLEFDAAALQVFSTARSELLHHGCCTEAGLWRRGMVTLAMPVGANSQGCDRVVMCVTPEKRGARERLIREVAPKLRAALTNDTASR